MSHWPAIFFPSEVKAMAVKEKLKELARDIRNKECNINRLQKKADSISKALKTPGDIIVKISYQEKVKEENKSNKMLHYEVVPFPADQLIDYLKLTLENINVQIKKKKTDKAKLEKKIKAL